jgi:hypothetical protein
VRAKRVQYTTSEMLAKHQFYLITSTILRLAEESLLETKCVLSYAVQISSEIFFTIWRVAFGIGAESNMGLNVKQYLKFSNLNENPYGSKNLISISNAKSYGNPSIVS